MIFELPALPYAKDALAPHISPETIDFHYGKHHLTYLNNLKAALEGKPEANKTLEEIVKDAPVPSPLFNNAAQVWNHNFYWASMKPNGGGAATGDIAKLIDRDFGDFAKFRDALHKAAIGQFGSGWAWVVESAGKLEIIGTSNADLPLTHGKKALLTIDVWEHAYYVDYRNARAKYVDTFLDHLANWDFANANLKG